MIGKETDLMRETADYSLHVCVQQSWWIVPVYKLSSLGFKQVPVF